MKHARGIVEIYQRLVPDTSNTLKAVAERALVEIETAEIQAARIAELEAALDNAQMTIHIIGHQDNKKSYDACPDCADMRNLLKGAK